MSRKDPVPLIRTAAIAPLLRELKQAGTLRELLLRTKLPLDLADRPDEFLPAHIALHFMAESANCMDAPAIAFDTVTRAHVDELGKWGSSIAQCYTLRAALNRLCFLYPLEASFLQMGLVEDETHAWLWRRRSLASTESAGERQGEQFTLGSLIHVVRLFAGSKWSPSVIRVESRLSESALHTDAFERSRVEFGGPVLAISIARDLLDQRRLRPTSCRRSTKRGGAPAAIDLVGSLVQALVPIATEVSLTLDLGAEIAETTPRTLQRWLAQEGTEWRAVVDRARFEASDRLLSDPSLSLIEIATMLGYSDHAHFTRAFQRWMGEAPSDYRHRRMN